MIGIFKKDVYMLLSAYKKNLLLLFALYAAITLGMKNTFFPAMTVWLMSFYSLSALTMDASSGWDRYARTLPVTPGRIVAARFLAALGMIAAGTLYALLLDAGLYLLHGVPLGQMLAGIAVSFAMALLSVGLLLPAAYQWGVEKARGVLLTLFLAVFLGILFLARENLVESAVNRIEGGNPVLVLTVLVLACAAVFVLGGVISCRIYRKKEF